MNIYLVTQDENVGYDTFDSIIVCAENEDIAKNTLPPTCEWGYCWAYSPDKVDVTLIGIANDDIEKGVIMASFNAG